MFGFDFVVAKKCADLERYRWLRFGQLLGSFDLLCLVTLAPGDFGFVFLLAKTVFEIAAEGPIESKNNFFSTRRLCDIFVTA